MFSVEYLFLCLYERYRRQRTLPSSAEKALAGMLRGKQQRQRYKFQ